MFYFRHTDIKYMEGLLPERYGADVMEIPGARDLLNALGKASVPWAIVTSGTRPLVSGWLKVLKLPVPEHMVVAEDVIDGKPDPTCYLMGKQKLGLDGGAEVLVLEDSPAGIRAGKAAGCKVLGVVTSHTVEQVLAAEPDWIVKDLSSVKLVSNSVKGVELEFLDALDVQ
jgi:glycerol-1-phosphatase